MLANSSSSRYCTHCEKAKKACICHLIKKIDCDIPVIILQHTTEAKKPIGTARILSLSLSKAKVFVGENFTEHTELNTLLADSKMQYMLLYPNENAINISKLKESSDVNKTLGLILLDGTWRKTYKIYQLSKNIQKLSCIALDEIEQSRYRIRKSAKSNGLATVEAGFYALSQITQHSTPFMPLIHAFDAMVEFQLKQMPKEIIEQRYGNQTCSLGCPHIKGSA